MTPVFYIRTLFLAASILVVGYIFLAEFIFEKIGSTGQWIAAVIVVSLGFVNLSAFEKIFPAHSKGSARKVALRFATFVAISSLSLSYIAFLFYRMMVDVGDYYSNSLFIFVSLGVFSLGFLSFLAVKGLEVSGNGSVAFEDVQAATSSIEKAIKQLYRVVGVESSEVREMHSYFTFNRSRLGDWDSVELRGLEDEIRDLTNKIQQNGLSDHDCEVIDRLFKEVKRLF